MADEDKNLSWEEARELLGEVIARHEGFYKDDSRAQRNNNPGNLTKGNGCSEFDGGGFCRYGTSEEGWDALHHQLNMMENGTSHVYNLAMTPTQFVARYASSSPAAEQAAYAAAIAAALGIKPDQKMEEKVDHWVTIDGKHVLLSY